MTKLKYFIIFMVCNMFINKTITQSVHFSTILTAIIIVAVLCVINAICARKRCDNAQIVGQKKVAITVLSVIPIIYWLPFLYLMLKPTKVVSS